MVWRSGRGEVFLEIWKETRLKVVDFPKYLKIKGYKKPRKSYFVGPVFFSSRDSYSDFRLLTGFIRAALIA